MIPKTMTGLLALAAMAVPGLAAAQAPSADDAAFVAKAGAGNALEVAEARLALQQAADPRLKQFAQKMIDDHTAAQKALADAAGKAGDPMPATMDPVHQAMLDNLKGFNGADFDKIYVADQVAAHAETVSLLSDYVQNGGNGSLKSWAKTTLPTVKGHLATIEGM